jgi:hypothetical protein
MKHENCKRITEEKKTPNSNILPVDMNETIKVIQADAQYRARKMSLT